MIKYFNDKKQYEEALSKKQAKADELMKLYNSVTELMINETREVKGKFLKILEKKISYATILDVILYFNLCWNWAGLNDEDLIREALKEPYILHLIKCLNFESTTFDSGIYIGCQAGKVFQNRNWELSIAKIVLGYFCKNDNIEIDDKESEYCFSAKGYSSDIFITYDDIHFIYRLIPTLINPLITMTIKNIEKPKLIK